MIQVKIIVVENEDYSALEDKINKWLGDHEREYRIKGIAVAENVACISYEEMHYNL